LLDFKAQPKKIWCLEENHDDNDITFLLKPVFDYQIIDKIVQNKKKLNSILVLS